MFSAHSKELRKTSLGPAQRPCSPWRQEPAWASAARPYLPSLCLLQPWAAIRTVRGAIFIPPPTASPANRGSDMKQPAAARILPALFHFLCLRANHTTLRPSRAGALGPRRVRQKEQEKMSYRKKRGEKERGRKTWRERASEKA